MRANLVLAATLASLLVGSAGAETMPGPSAAQVPSTGTSGTPSGESPFPAVTDAGTAAANAEPTAKARRMTEIRIARARAVRWARRRKVQPHVPPRAEKIVRLTLPSFDMTALFERSGEQLIVVPRINDSTQASAPSVPAPASVAAVTSTPAPAGNTAAHVATSSAAAAPHPDARPRPAEPNVARQATGEAEPVSAISTTAYTWILPVANATKPTILLRTGPDTGLAAFRAGAEIVLVLDAPIDFRAPAVGLDPAFAQLSSQRTEDATVIRIPMASEALGLSRAARGWLVTAGSEPASPVKIVPELVGNRSVATSIRFPAAEPARVVTVIDPQTGDQLLVGTQDTAGQAVTIGWQQAKFSLLPTLQGVVVEAVSNDMRLRSEKDGFTLSTGLQAGEPIIPNSDVKGAGGSAANTASRLFVLPNGSTRELAAELEARIRAASSAPELARSEQRLRVAEAMLALGMDVEAQSVLDIAAAADPALLNTPRAMALGAIAAILAGRFDHAGALDDPRLKGSHEIQLWRGFRQAVEDEATAADAQSLADGLPLVLTYPQTLRDRLLPKILETMALNGQAAPAQSVLKSLPDDQDLDLARAMVLEMTNQTAAALQAYDRIANGSDRLRRYTAEVRAIELRMKSGQLDARAGPDALDRDLFAWRGPRQELALRTRIAALRRQTGQWREALAVLRDGRDAFPEDHAQMDRELATTFTAFIGDPSAKELSPSEFVALYDQNADIVRDINWSNKTGTKLVDRLMRLGLQGRAEPVMVNLLAQAADPAERARLGERLADLRMTLNDPAGAIASLADTAPPATVTIDPNLAEARQLLYAHGETERGDQDAALTMLRELGTAKADAARADIYIARKDWPQTVAALTAWEKKAISTPDLTDKQQAMVMRLAVAATLSSDTATLDRLAGTYGPAMSKGKSAAFFRLLTSAPIRDAADLPRATAEMQLAQQLASNPGAMEAP
jgi:hypothetical protein